MKCSAVNNLLSAYLDGELADVERAVVEEHLRGCASCAALLRSLKASVALVSSLPRQPAPAGFAREVQERIEPSAAAKEHGVRHPDRKVCDTIFRRPTASPLVAAASRRRLMRLLPRYAAAAAILLSVAAVGYITLRPYRRVPVAPDGYAPGRADERLAKESDGYFSNQDGRRAQQAPGPGNETLGLGSDSERLEKDFDAARTGNRIARAQSGATRRETVEEGAEYRQHAADVAAQTDAWARRLLDRDDAWEVKGAEVRLAAAPVNVRITASDVADGTRVVRDLLTANGWMADATAARKAEAGESSRIDVVVPEGQMLGFIKTLGSREDIRVAELNFGEAKVLGSTADEVSRLARGLSTEAPRGRETAPRPAALEAARPETPEPAGKRDVAARLFYDLADRRAPAPSAAVENDADVGAGEAAAADEPAAGQAAAGRKSTAQPEAEEESRTNAVQANAPASGLKVADGGKGDERDQGERRHRTSAADVAGPGAAPAPAPMREVGHSRGGVRGPGTAPVADEPEGRQIRSVAAPTTRSAVAPDEKHRVKVPDRLKEAEDALEEPSVTFAVPTTESPGGAGEPVRQQVEQGLRYGRKPILGDLPPGKDESRDGASHGIAASRPSSRGTEAAPVEDSRWHSGMLKAPNGPPEAVPTLAPAELDKTADDTIDRAHLFRGDRPTTKAALAKEGWFDGGQGGGAPAEAASAPAIGRGESEDLRRAGESPPLVYHVTIVIERAPVGEAPAAYRQ